MGARRSSSSHPSLSPVAHMIGMRPMATVATVMNFGRRRLDGSLEDGRHATPGGCAGGLPSLPGRRPGRGTGAWTRLSPHPPPARQSARPRPRCSCCSRASRGTRKHQLRKGHSQKADEGFGERTGVHVEQEGESEESNGKDHAHPPCGNGLGLIRFHAATRPKTLRIWDTGFFSISPTFTPMTCCLSGIISTDQEGADEVSIFESPAP